MSTLKTINVIHPSGSVNNIVNDASGNVTIGNNLTVTGATTLASIVSPLITGGTTPSSTLTLKSTSGVGTSDSILLKVGNNGATTAMTIDTSGNVGIGVVPSAWAAASYALQIGAGASVFSNNVAYSYFGANSYFDGTNWRYMGTGAAAQYVQSAGASVWYYAASGSAGAALSWQEAMRIDASGNVGIGTGPGETIGATLEVRGAVGTALRIRSMLNSVEPTGYYSIGRDTTDGLLKFNGAQTTFVGYKFFNTGSEVMRIDSNGNVGIGTASPTSKLAVTSAINDGISVTDGTVRTVLYSSTGSLATIGTTTNHPLQFFTNNSSKMYIDTSGNVGIGTALPATKLDVNGTIRSKTSTGGIVNMDSPTAGTTNTIGSYANAGVAFADLNYSAAAHIWYGSGNERMRIDSSGNVGIGGTSTGSKLWVGGDVTLGANGIEGGQITFNNTGNTTVGMTIDVAGADVGRIFGGRNNFALQMGQFGGTGGIVQFYTESSERMRIDSNGDMQVGTTSNINNARISVQNSLNCYVAYTTNNSYTTFQGFGAAGTGSSTFYVLGSGQIYSTSTSIIAISDQTLKANIKPLETGLAEVLALKPRRFDWSEKSINEGSNIAGFIAQEVQAVLPDLVAPYQYGKDETKLGLKMGDMIPTLVAAIQELAAEVAALKAK